MGRKMKRPLTIHEWVVLFCVLGMFASVAVPSYLQFQKQSRIQKLLDIAQAFHQDLASSSDMERALRQTMQLYNRQRKNPAAEGPLFLLESGGMRPAICSRDGKIHVIPLEDREGRFKGVTLVVTNTVYRGGPADDGLLGSLSLFVHRKD